MPRTFWTPTGRPRGRPRGAQPKPRLLADGTPNLTPNQKRAIAAEIKTQKWEADRAARVVAAAAGVSGRAVRGWRNDPAYAAALQAALDAVVVAALTEKLAARDARDEAELAQQRKRQNIVTKRLLAGLPREPGGIKGEFDPADWRWLPPAENPGK